jgi:penicillin-binding protein 1A
VTIKHFFSKIFQWIFFSLVTVLFCVAIVAFYVFNEIKDELPDVKQLHDVTYQVPLSIYSKDEVLLAKFGEKKRVPITIDEVPKQLVDAFLAAEDGNFYTHSGVDYKGLARAVIQLILTGKKKQGVSTITMQVTRNFLLTREKTYRRKIKEIILALEIEKEFSKDKILEFYLNKIFLGHHSYGIAAASMTYYGKGLSELNLSQLAMLAGLPKAPSIYNPVSNPKRAILRRDYVLRRMHELNYITQEQFTTATEQPVSASIHRSKFASTAPYISEMVRQEVFDHYGEEAYTLGLKVYTTIDSSLQSTAIRSLRSALHGYDHRHGYHSLPHKNKAKLTKADYMTKGDTQTAHVIKIEEEVATVMLKEGGQIKLPFKSMLWARKFKSPNYRGAKLTSMSEILSINDVIKVRQKEDSTWELAQIPNIEAAFAALDSKTGAIIALTGGFDFFNNKYNRAIQSKRQPGSGFKPIIYTTALENGFTPASLINDAPVVIDDPMQEDVWRPENYSKKFFGMTPLRTGLRKSRNLISIRLLRDLGIKKVTDMALRFGFKQEQLPHGLSLALGSGHATPLQMATMYSVFGNGGFLVKPYLIEKITDYNDKVVFQASPKVACPLCSEEEILADNSTIAPRIISPQITFLMNSLLRDVVQRGTATAAKVLKRQDLAGKTGTTNEQRDTWFNGFSSGIAATAWLGYDSSKPLGRRETGGKAALPIWIGFMRSALAGKPDKELQPPEGISKVYIDPGTSLLASSGSSRGIWEFFLEKDAPTRYAAAQRSFNNSEEAEEESLF